jgi:hypothetical protein
VELTIGGILSPPVRYVTGNVTLELSRYSANTNVWAATGLRLSIMLRMASRNGNRILNIGMGIFKTFKEWVATRDDVQQKVSGAVAKSLNSMAPDQAMGAIQGNDPMAQKKLVARSLAKPAVRSIDDVAPVVGIKVKNPVNSMMRKMRKK